MSHRQMSHFQQKLLDEIPFVDLRAQYRMIGEEIVASIREVLSRGDFILGSKVSEFERAFAEFTSVKHAIGVGSGLDALRVALMALDIGPGDEVILPANTFIATAFAVDGAGAKPVLIDCDPRTYGIDVSAIESVMTPKTRAIIPVHLTGQPADMDPILEIARRRRIHVVEDAAQAHGSYYKGRPCGSMGIAGCFSFYPGKNLGAYGDAGLIATNDDDFAGRCNCIRNYGQRVKYEHREKGLNTRLDTLQAAVLVVKLKYISRWNSQRSEHARCYKELLDGVGDLQFQAQQPDSTHIYHLFIVETGAREPLQEYLSKAGVQTGIHYPIPIHLQEAYRDLGYGPGDFPTTERLARRMLSLPMYPELTVDQIEQVSSLIKSFFRDGKR